MDFSLMTQSSHCKCRGNMFTLTSTDPAYQYQTQKKIQNTTGVSSSLYAMNLGSLAVNANQSSPLWNQMSDRSVPHIQTTNNWGGGGLYRGNSLRRTQTGIRPGSTTPGGIGVDVKHGSYNRYMARLKTQRRPSSVPSTFGEHIEFNRAIPVYGGKTIQTSILAVSKLCPCDDGKNNNNNNNDLANIYKRTSECPDFDSKIVYSVGDVVYARESIQDKFSEAIILYEITHDLLTVQFIGSNEIRDVYPNEGHVIPYFPCNCEPESDGDANISNRINSLVTGKYAGLCYKINEFTEPNYKQFVEQYAPLLLQYGRLPGYLRT